jgi:hypothetical protein
VALSGLLQLIVCLEPKFQLFFFFLLLLCAMVVRWGPEAEEKAVVELFPTLAVPTGTSNLRRLLYPNIFMATILKLEEFSLRRDLDTLTFAIHRLNYTENILTQYTYALML